MTGQDVGAALERLAGVLQRRPSAGLQGDAPALARWDGGLRTVSTAPNGHDLVTDMPAELGGAGGEMTAGWVWRSSLAACATTCIAIAAAKAGVALDLLEVTVSSRSDMRGFLGLPETDGSRVCPAPQDLRMHVRIGARGASAATLQALVATGQGNSALASALAVGPSMSLRVEIAGA